MKFWFGKKEESAPDTAPETAPAVAQEQAQSASPAAAPHEGRPSPEPPHLPPTPPGPTGPERPISPPLAPAPTPLPPPPNQKVLYYQLMNGLYDAVMILDQNGHIVDCNTRVTPVLGYDRDEMWDMPVSDVIKGMGPQIFQQMKDALYNNHQVLINAKCTRKDGVVFQGEVGVCLMHLTRGENLVFTIRNVEKRIAEIMRKVQSQAHGADQPPSNAPRAVLKAVHKVGN